jgi:hypothetical protein
MLNWVFWAKETSVVYFHGYYRIFLVELRRDYDATTVRCVWAECLLYSITDDVHKYQIYSTNNLEFLWALNINAPKDGLYFIR